MIIYNVTVKISWLIADQWVTWMQQKHIPDIMKTECFSSHQFVKLLNIDEEEGPTYATQFYASTRAEVDIYIDEHAPTLRDGQPDVHSRYADDAAQQRQQTALEHE